jgi:hypothetical protein
MKSGLLLDIVIGKGTAILKLLASKDKTLLIRRNTLLVLDLRLNIIDGVGGLDLESDGLASDYESVRMMLLTTRASGGDDATRHR